MIFKVENLRNFTAGNTTRNVAKMTAGNTSRNVAKMPATTTGNVGRLSHQLAMKSNFLYSGKRLKSTFANQDNVPHLPVPSLKNLKQESY